MTGKNLYEALVARGYSLTAKEDKLFVTPREGLTPEECEQIKEHKQEILSLLTANPAVASIMERLRKMNIEMPIEIAKQIVADGVRIEYDDWGLTLVPRLSCDLYMRLVNFRKQLFFDRKAIKTSLQMDEE